jgi:hypothetical protein
MSAKVKLYVRIVRPDGSRTYAPPVYAANRRLRPGYALVDGQPKHHPEAVYYLRHTEGDRRVWTNVGTDAVAALGAMAVQQHLVNGVSLGIPALQRRSMVRNRPKPAN